VKQFLLSLVVAIVAFAVLDLAGLTPSSFDSFLIGLASAFIGHDGFRATARHYRAIRAYRATKETL